MHLEGRRGAMSYTAWWVITPPDWLLCWFYPLFLKLRHFSACIHPSVCDSADREIDLEWESIYNLYDMQIERFRKATDAITFPLSLHRSYCRAKSSHCNSSAVICLFGCSVQFNKHTNSISSPSCCTHCLLLSPFLFFHTFIRRPPHTLAPAVPRHTIESDRVYLLSKIAVAWK